MVTATKRCSRGRATRPGTEAVLGRQHRLADPTGPRHIEQGETMAETYSGEFYCVKCKEKREASGEVHVNDKGTRMAKAKCPVCGTNLNRILGKA